MPPFFRRLYGAMALAPRTYEEVEADTTADAQALIVVLLSALASGVGAQGLGVTSASLPTLVLLSVFTWCAWSMLTYQVGVQVLPAPRTRSDLGELLRTLGFAAAPGVVNILGLVPGWAPPVFAVTSVWLLCAMVVAVRQALDFASLWRAVAVCVVGAVLSMLVVLLLGSMLSPVLTSAV